MTSAPFFSAAGIDACDRCLALSELTLALGRVPLPRDPSDPEASGLAADFGALDPVPGALAAATQGVSPDRAARLRADLLGWSAADVRRRCVDGSLTAACRCSSSYPACLHDLADAPPVVYFRGDTSALDECDQNAIAMVGTRRPTLVGREAARRIAGGISRSGAVVVSGMALGIDAAAHEGALSVRGTTVAVLAGGADRPSPNSHRRLYDQILERGLVVSEMPPGTEPYRWCFPARNRIIAALARATVVVEAPLRSGALITVEQAQDLGRDVYAVPGSLASDMSEGTNRMLCDGAMAVVDGAALVPHRPAASLGRLVQPVDGALAEVHAALARGPLSIDELGERATSLGPGEVELALLDLELAGWVSRRPDGRYRVVDRWAA